MYEIGAHDRVVEVSELPRSSIGSPCPVVLGDEHTTVLAYYLQRTSDDDDGTSPRVVGHGSSDDPLAIITLSRCYATMLGPPNDEAISGHPLAARGLRPYAAFRVESSSWIRRLARMNSVHPDHSDTAFDPFQHLVFAFHDSTFEAICADFQVTHANGSIASVIPRMIELLSSAGTARGRGQ